MVKRRLYTSELTTFAPGVISSSRKSTAGRPSQEEKQGDRDHIQDPNPLMVGGQQPRADRPARHSDNFRENLLKHG
jgi:hypothetical protein